MLLSKQTNFRKLQNFLSKLWETQPGFPEPFWIYICVYPLCTAIFIKGHTLTSHSGPINLSSLIMSVLIAHSSKWWEISQKPLWFLAKQNDYININFVFVMWAEDKINLLFSGLRRLLIQQEKSLIYSLYHFYCLYTK
jgi:hypothetical protein